MFSVMNKKKAIESRIIDKFKIFEVYANNSFTLDSDARAAFFFVPGKGGIYDTADKIFLELLDILKIKLTVSVTFRDIAEAHFGYKLIYRGGVWYV